MPPCKSSAACKPIWNRPLPSAPAKLAAACIPPRHFPLLSVLVLTNNTRNAVLASEGSWLSMSTAQKRLKNLRIIHAVFLLAAFSYLIVPLRLTNVQSQAPPQVLAVAIGITAAATLGVAAFLRMRLIQPSSETLRNNPEDTAALL